MVYFFAMETTKRKVGFDQFLLGLLGFRFAAVNERQRALQFGEPDFAGFFDVLQFGAARAQFLARFRRHIALGDVRAAFQPPGFAFQRLQALDRAAHLVDQPLLLKRVEIDVANARRKFPRASAPRPTSRGCTASSSPSACLSSFAACFSAVSYKFRNLVDVLQRLLGLVGDFFFGQLFIVKLHDLFDGPRALAQIFANRNQFLDDDRRTRDGLHHHQLPALDALGDGHFAFARQQRHGAHLAQIHAHGIVGFFQRARESDPVRCCLRPSAHRP